MIARRILVLGATGMLGKPVVQCLLDRGYQVRIMVHNLESARRRFGNTVEAVVGDARNEEAIQAVMAGCDAVHVNLTQEAELTAMQHIVNLAPGNPLERVSYVSATTVCEENRWFEMVDIKMRTEAILQQSGIAHTVFYPTWVMETLPNFIHGNQAVVILGRHPPALHFFAAADFGRMVAAAYEDDRALGKRLFVHGPQAITLPEAVARLIHACYPQAKVRRVQLWQAEWVAKLTRRQDLAYVTWLIAYFDKVEEIGDPKEANALLGAPKIALDEWFKMPREDSQGLPH
jgi:uncharacterized protein YbjT (DUF2867 family)